MPTEAEVYGYGTIANLICCVCSLAGAFTIPFAKKYKTAYNVVLSVFMGLAVGALASDAILHLVPEALGLHHHGPEPKSSSNESHSPSHDFHHHRKRDTHQTADTHHHGNHNHHHPEEAHFEGDHDAVHMKREHHVEPYIWYCMVLLLGAYVFYLVEMAMVHVQRKTQGEQTPVTLTAFNNQAVDAIIKEKEGEEQRNSRGRKAITPLVVMIIIGDALHNFTDGLAIAASFSTSLLEGIAITIAIFCHELPQELGDFAILISEGLTFKKALIANLFSSLTAFIGFYIGVPISSNMGAKPWIFSITAGMFLYISLVDMLPSLIKNGSTNVRTFVYHNIGILIGALVIILLAIFESKIEIDH
ncbi:zinc transporter ZIP12-like [Saccostrea echinata]|uniref:zinc transporter ZIP12-like n=1 Tax=Saccostrea echinata TaxID=191078 RepID=UPI002A83ACFF|nr:zinc transporter ZIP12-like [Saccostrea echinata]XP_061197016.1 zinc transporter ZIP12-like [Saccostrea echinata]XP_061197017.1 zinc transporter ZIP12-like [Saccostrea echinata]XP_061197018.1 zinc transporter ZIP12-like [Saccostrea echinata]